MSRVQLTLLIRILPMSTHTKTVLYRNKILRPKQARTTVGSVQVKNILGIFKDKSMRN